MTSRDMPAWMWAEACEMLERAERLQRQFFQLGQSAARPVWEPPVDLIETESAVLVLVALPGVAPERVEAVIDSGALTVAAERPLPVTSARAVIHRLEIPHGRFERRIPLPGGRFEVDRRELTNGCLVLGLRRLT